MVSLRGMVVNGPDKEKNFYTVAPSILTVSYTMNKQLPPFGMEICSDICPQTLSVRRSEQFSKSVAQGKL